MPSEEFFAVVAAEALADSGAFGGRSSSLTATAEFVAVELVAGAVELVVEAVELAAGAVELLVRVPAPMNSPFLGSQLLK